jgi:hypothetical protein
MARGVKTGGRKSGTPNKTTATVKEALQLAYAGMGGAEALTTWAKANPTEFYRLWARMLPTEIKGSGATLEDLIVGTAERLARARRALDGEDVDE